MLTFIYLHLIENILNSWRFKFSSNEVATTKTRENEIDPKPSKEACENR
jgi:hypothetical protein